MTDTDGRGITDSLEAAAFDHQPVAMAQNSVTKVIRSADGTPIYAEAVGDHTNVHVVFVHGMSFSGAAFDSVFGDKTLLNKLYMVRVITIGLSKTCLTV